MVTNRKEELMQDRLSTCIDVMGQKSAEAQDLKKPITSAAKLIKSDHRLYMIKDSFANHGKGTLIGILKVGKKKLFLSNRYANQVEVTPLCLLDFYIHESRQRQGCGFYLFKVMLEIEGITPLHLAIDRPSRKLLNFLEKHYGLDQPEFHPNRYVVFPGFLQCVRGDTMERGIDKQIKQSGDKGEHTSQLVAVNQSERMPNVPSPSSACGAPHSLPTSPDATKSCQISGFTPGRYDSDKRWQQMYDSWNVIGVPPRDYSYLKSGRYPPSRSGTGKNDMP